MIVYVLVKTTDGYKDNVSLFDSQVKALSAQTSLQMEQFDNANLVGVSFDIEEWYVK